MSVGLCPPAVGTAHTHHQHEQVAGGRVPIYRARATRSPEELSSFLAASIIASFTDQPENGSLFFMYPTPRNSGIYPAQGSAYQYAPPLHGV